MNIPAIEERFLQPANWQWSVFKRGGRTLRYGFVFPEGKTPDAVVVCLLGLSEFAEKYFETARDCLGQNLAFFVIDWMGQGKSDRYIANSQKRHSLGYQHDIEDLHAFTTQYVQPQTGQIPLVLLAHSMGAHIGTHYLLQHPGIFRCAGFSAPLFYLKVFEHLPAALALGVAKVVNSLFSQNYVQGFGDWRKEVRSTPAINFYSGDDVRAAVHNAWCLSDTKLQVGGITYGWILETHKSCMKLWKNSALKAIKIPCFIASAGKETFVSNNAIRRASKIMPNAKLLELPDSRHEILMERDSIRKAFVDGFFKLVRENLK